MKLEIVNASVVVTATQHNPSILHPSFLTSQDIVEADWVLAEQPICTPPLAIVKFKNGIVFTAQPEQLQVTDNLLDEDVASSVVSELVERYVRTLPHVQYSAVGVNFKAFVEVVDAATFLIERFLKNGSLEQWRVTNTSVRHTFCLPAANRKAETWV